MNGKTASAYGVIFVGGCLGTSLRVLVTQVLPSGSRWTTGLIPWGTLAVNLVGAFLLGLLASVLAARFPTADPRVRMFLGTGILGSLTTYGTFISEASRGAIPYVAASLVLGLLCAWLGVLCGSRTTPVARFRRIRQPDGNTSDTRREADGIKHRATESASSGSVEAERGNR